MMLPPQGIGEEMAPPAAMSPTMAPPQQDMPAGLAPRQVGGVQPLPVILTTQKRYTPEAEKPIVLPDDDRTRDLVRRICDNLEASKGVLNSYWQRITEDLTLYDPRRKRTSKPHPDACELIIPVLIYTENALQARFRRALFGTTPLWNFEGVGTDARSWAQPTEDFSEKQAGPSNCNFREELRPVLADSTSTGTGYAYIEWRTDIRKRVQYAVVMRPVLDPTTGQPMTDLQGQPITTPPEIEPTEVDYPFYDGPKVHRLAYDKVIPYPADCPSFEEADGVGLVFSKSGHELLLGVQSNTYDKEAVRRLSEWKGDAQQTDAALVIQGIDNGDFYPDSTFHATRYEITECYWRHAEDPMEPARDWLITLHVPTKAVLRAIPNPWWFQDRPVLNYSPLPGKYGVIGRSLPELIGDNQEAQSTLLQLFIDNLAWEVAPPLLMRKGSMTEMEKAVFQRNLRPRSIWEVTNPDQIKAIDRSVKGDGPNIGLPLFETLRGIQARASSIDDTNLGKQAARGSTATEIEEMLAEGEVMFADMVNSLAIPLAKMGRLVKQMNYQMCGHRAIQQLWETVNGPDPSGMGLSALIAFGHDYEITATGSAEAANHALRKRQASEMYGVLMQSPLVMGDLQRVHAVTQELLNAFAVRYPERFIGSEAQAMQQQQMQQQQMMLSALMGGGAGAAGQPARR